MRAYPYKRLLPLNVIFKATVIMRWVHHLSVFLKLVELVPETTQPHSSLSSFHIPITEKYHPQEETTKNGSNTQISTVKMIIEIKTIELHDHIVLIRSRSLLWQTRMIGMLRSQICTLWLGYASFLKMLWAEKRLKSVWFI